MSEHKWLHEIIPLLSQEAGLLKGGRNMEKNVVLKNDGNNSVKADEMLKATALLYFQDALYTEKYESCFELMQAAKSYGAQQSDISKIIAQFVQRLQGNSQGEANKNGTSRFLL